MTTPQRIRVYLLGSAVLLGLLGASYWACGGEKQIAETDVAAIMEARGLTEEDVMAALKTYMPTGRHDDYYMFASGGHSGQVLVIGLPSMRILKVIAVFTPEPWQGYGYGDQTDNVLAMGNRDGRDLTWGDTHHPALSETGGDYDGEYLFINDKANARVAVINLDDFVTTQIVYSPLIRSDHGSTMVTPNTEYIVEGSQYPVPLDGTYAPIEQFDDSYRGAVIFWKFDRAHGRIAPDQSWALELPPYMQDIADAGKRASDGWIFLNSLDTELAHGGNAEGNPSLEEGASQHDMDYLHLINWRRAEELVEAGRTVDIQGFPVLPLETAVAEGVIYFVGEPKSPHGVDVSPDGESIVVSGKLDAHATVYSFSQMMSLVQNETFEGHDPYGVPILNYEQSVRGQVDVGLGPLHTQFDGEGFAYTSLFLEPAVAKWSLDTLQVVDKLNVHYNVGHISVAEGDTVSPDGHYLVSMNKWALDRFASVGPLLPQNFQLIDISGERMQLLYDLPIPLGEPHYAQIISADKLDPIDVYTPRGTDPLTGEVDPHAVTAEDDARIERNGDDVDVYMTAIRSHFRPDIVRVQEGQHVHFHITNIEQAHDATHGFTIASHNVQLSLEPGEYANVDLVADRPGVYPFYCTEFCSALHLEMAGYFIVEPAPEAPPTPPTGGAPAPAPAPGGP